MLKNQKLFKGTTCLSLICIILLLMSSLSFAEEFVQIAPKETVNYLTAAGMDVDTAGNIYVVDSSSFRIKNSIHRGF